MSQEIENPQTELKILTDKKETEIRDSNEPIKVNEVHVESNKEEDETAKKLMFEKKNISAVKLICHLSYGMEVFIMILGIIGSL